MAVPFPVTITAKALPLGFKGNLQETLNAFAESLSATVQPVFITGQLGGTTPSSNIGPWANGNEWWFWDSNPNSPTYRTYVPSEQGVPVGTIAIWGGQGTPTNWLLCDGSAVPIKGIYYRLYTVIGTTWGPGDGVSTFNLPPGGHFFVNAGKASPTSPSVWKHDPAVPLESGWKLYEGEINERGGQQKVTLADNNIPPLQVTVPWLSPSFTAVPAGYVVPNIQPAGANTGNANTYPVTDNQGGKLGVNQAPVPTVPPYVAANFIIKFQ